MFCSISTKEVFFVDFFLNRELYSPKVEFTDFPSDPTTVTPTPSCVDS